jgi:hypothetical protein
VLGDDHPDTLTTANILAAILTRVGKYQATRGFDEGIDTSRERTNEDDEI